MAVSKQLYLEKGIVGILDRTSHQDRESKSALVRRAISEYVEFGTTSIPTRPERVPVQITVDPDLYQSAKLRALTEGRTLTDALEAKMAELYE